MTWFERVRVVILAVGVVGAVGADAATVREGQERPADHIPVTQAVSAALGRIVGAVTDPAGVPLDGAVVSAFGPSGPELALANAGGRFMLRSLAPGAYFVQAHLPGFAASRRELVGVSANIPTMHAITLSRVGPAAETVAASVGVPFHAASAERGDGADSGYSSEQPAATDQTVVDGAAGTGTSAPHDHGAKAWYLRRAQRSVLKDAETLVAAVPLSPGEWSAGRTAMLARTAASAARFATGLFDLPLSGEVNLLTRGMLDAAQDMIAVVPGSAGIANLSVGAPVWHGDWLAQGAMSTGDLSGLVVSGAYLADSEASHQLAFTVSYGQQRYQSANPAALTIAAESRYAASFGASDRWTVSRRLTIDYGGRYATYGYTEEDGLFSPRVGVTVTPLTGLRIRVGASQEMVAPGNEEFLPPTGTSLWLPPERTFAAFTPLAGLQPERTRHFDVGLEVDLTEHYVLGVRRSYQNVTDQRATLFGINRLGVVPAGHYYLARAGAVTSRAWVVTLSRQLGKRFSGSVDYMLANASWNQAGVDTAIGVVVPGAIRASQERFHDVSGAFSVEIPETVTRLLVRCRVNTAFVKINGDTPIGLDARFDIRVNQPLPFSPFDGSQWEVLVAVRSLFFEPQNAASTFDELLVVRAPKEFVGGLVVHF